MQEHYKLNAVKDKSQIIGEFLEWLQNETKYVIAEYGYGNFELFQADINIEKLLAQYFEIDLNKLAQEKDELYEQLRRELTQ